MANRVTRWQMGEMVRRCNRAERRTAARLGNVPSGSVWARGEVKGNANAQKPASLRATNAKCDRLGW